MHAFSPGYARLVCDFCSSGQGFAFGFLQIPGHPGHPCRLTVPTIRVRRGLAPPSHQSATTADWMALTRHAPCRAHTQKGGISDPAFSFPGHIFFFLAPFIIPSHRDESTDMVTPALAKIHLIPLGPLFQHQQSKKMPLKILFSRAVPSHHLFHKRCVE